jgi:alpha-aminoadipate/glutamate carrier protein LysW
MTECPECGADVKLNDGCEQGEILSCSDCGSELEVVSINPMKLELAPEEQSDWGE